MSSEQKSAESSKPYMDPKLLPDPVQHLLGRKDIQLASNAVKRFVESRFEEDFKMFKHTSPLAFKRGTGVNDDLDGSKSKSAVSFHVPNLHVPRGIKVDTSKMVEVHGFDAEVVQSLAKWKRIMLQWYDVPVGEGLFCESFSIRKGYFGDVTHSSVVDQWDWEVRITEEQRTVETLKTYVRKVYAIIKGAEAMIREKFPALQKLEPLPEEVTFVTSQQLYDNWPKESIHGRENKAVEKWKAIFIIGMGWPLPDGVPEEVRSPGYDDWLMNGDLMVQHPLTKYRHELSSMGVRVNAESIKKQILHRGFKERLDLPYQQAVLNDKLPFCIGGGVGISRLLMLLLGTNHIGQVQCGLWADAHYAQTEAAGVDLIPDRLNPSGAKE